MLLLKLLLLLLLLLSAVVCCLLLLLPLMLLLLPLMLLLLAAANAGCCNPTAPTAGRRRLGSGGARERRPLRACFQKPPAVGLAHPLRTAVAGRNIINSVSFKLPHRLVAGGHYC